jgi:hypothetical protein
VDGGVLAGRFFGRESFGFFVRVAAMEETSAVDVLR